MFQSEKYLSAVKHFPFSLSLSFLDILHLGARGGEYESGPLWITAGRDIYK